VIRRGGEPGVTGRSQEEKISQGPTWWREMREGGPGRKKFGGRGRGGRNGTLGLEDAKVEERSEEKVMKKGSATEEENQQNRPFI